MVKEPVIFDRLRNKWDSIYLYFNKNYLVRRKMGSYSIRGAPISFIPWMLVSSKEEGKPWNGARHYSERRLLGK